MRTVKPGIKPIKLLSTAYYGLKDEYTHQIINHLEKYVDGMAQTALNISGVCLSEVLMAPTLP